MDVGSMYTSLYHLPMYFFQDLFDSSIWNNSADSPSSPQGKPVDPERMYLSASNKMECMSPSLLKRIQSPENDLPSLLASIGLEKYIR